MAERGIGSERGKKQVPSRPGSAERKQETVSAARRAAFQVLVQVGGGQAHSDELLHAQGRGAALEGLSEADRNLAMALVMGVLRWQIALDKRLRGLFTRPDNAVVEEVMVALRLGAFQLLHMDRIPAHAVLSESVALVRAAGQDYATGMVNAVLRKIAAGPKSEPTKIYETTGAAAERLGHPAWLVERWANTYGRGPAMTVCEADQREPAAGGLLTPAEGLPPMDEGSRLVAEMAAAAAPVIEGRAARVWDCCAAPGGKTAVLAARLPGAELLATDASKRRLRAMEERLGSRAASAGLGGAVRCLVADAAALPKEEGLFDLVLCDVPCSGTGTLGRNPEIRLRLREVDFARQAERQRSLLAGAMQRVAEGGTLVYSTCSLEPEECERVAETVLREAGAEWTQMDATMLLNRLREGGILQGSLEGAVRGKALRTLPGVHPGDGFYAIALRRTASARV